MRLVASVVAMDDLLTTRQLQEVLKVDRTTVYRMLKDRRLKGVKIGQQWRFPAADVATFLSQTPVIQGESAPATVDVVPLHCVAPIQRVFAEVAGVGAVTTSSDGEPLTEISNACAFCRMILASATGRKACRESWRKVAHQPEHRPQLVSCHAGLQYARARIEVNGEFAAMIIAGQFLTSVPEADEQADRVAKLALLHGIDREALAAAAAEIPVLEPRRRDHMPDWLEDVASTFEDISHERADLIGRLRHIAEMSSVAIR